MLCCVPRDSVSFMSGSGEITRLPADWSSGNQAALDKLVPLVYDELCRLASNYMRRERPGHVLRPDLHCAVCVRSFALFLAGQLFLCYEAVLVAAAICIRSHQLAARIEATATIGEQCAREINQGKAGAVGAAHIPARAEEAVAK